MDDPSKGVRVEGAGGPVDETSVWFRIARMLGDTFIVFWILLLHWGMRAFAGWTGQKGEWWVLVLLNGLGGLAAFGTLGIVAIEVWKDWKRRIRR